VSTIAPFDQVALVTAFTGGVTSVSRAMVNSQGNAQAAATKSIDALFSSRIDAARSALNDSTVQATVGLLRQKSLLVGRKDRLNEALNVLGKAQDQFVYLKNHIDYLQDRIAALEAGDITASEFSTEFDNKLRKINQLTDAAAVTYTDGGVYYSKNLIDSTSRLTYAPQSLYAPYNSSTDSYQIDGVYLGTDYNIVADGSGNVFLSDTGFLANESDTGTLTEYATFPGAPTGVSSSVTDITLNSIDTSTGAVQFTSAATGTVTGTLNRGGLGLLDSWLYDNFTTADGIARAKSDLDAAEGTILTAEAGFNADATTLQARANLFDAQILGLDHQITARVSKINDERQADLTSVQLQYAIAKFDFSILAAHGTSMIQSMLLAQDARGAGDTTAFGNAVTGSLLSVSA
jgi:hypothetical protein